MPQSAPSFGRASCDRAAELWRRHHEILSLLLPMLLYAVAVADATVRRSDQINPDGICYVRMAGYLIGGHAYESVSGYWSPLVSWCIAPLLAVGMDGVHAARLVLAVWGGVLLIASHVFAKRFTTLSSGWRTAALSVIALVAATWAAYSVTPDVIVGACLILYFACVVDPLLLDSRRGQLLCGLCGGVSYLAKAYALPFFMVHFPIAIALRHFVSREAADGTDSAAETPLRARTFRRLAAAWGTGLLGFALVAGPWVGLLSWKYGRPTYSTAGGVAHAVVGPPDCYRDHPMHRGLWTPPEPHMTVWEVPETLPYRRWSPFESGAYMTHQLKLAVGNVLRIRGFVTAFDLFGFSLGVIGLAPILAILLRRRRGEMFRVLWVAATAAVYCSGYVLLCVESRHLAPVLWPVLSLLCFHLASVLCEHIRAPAAGGGPADGKLVGRLTVALLVVSFAAFTAPALLLRKCIGWQSPSSFRAVAADIRAAGCEGPLASTRCSEGLYVAYHAGERFLGSPLARDAAGCDVELRRHGVRTFLVWRTSGFPGSSLREFRWRRKLTIRTPDVAPGEGVDVYVPAQDGDALPGSPDG